MSALNCIQEEMVAFTEHKSNIYQQYKVNVLHRVLRYNHRLHSSQTTMAFEAKTDDFFKIHSISKSRFW